MKHKDRNYKLTDGIYRDEETAIIFLLSNAEYRTSIFPSATFDQFCNIMKHTELQLIIVSVLQLTCQKELTPYTALQV